MREKHATIRDCVNRITEIAILAADAVEVVAEVPVFSKRLCIIRESAVLGAERKIETLGRGQSDEIER